VRDCLSGADLRRHRQSADACLPELKRHELTDRTVKARLRSSRSVQDLLPRWSDTREAGQYASGVTARSRPKGAPTRAQRLTRDLTRAAVRTTAAAILMTGRTLVARGRGRRAIRPPTPPTLSAIGRPRGSSSSESQLSITESRSPSPGTYRPTAFRGQTPRSARPPLRRKRHVRPTRPGRACDDARPFGRVCVDLRISGLAVARWRRSDRPVRRTSRDRRRLDPESGRRGRGGMPTTSGTLCMGIRLAPRL
jgi:hypothetical protein